MSSKSEVTKNSELVSTLQPSAMQVHTLGNTTADRLRAVTKSYEKRRAAEVMAEQPLEELIDQVISVQNEYIAELEARIEELESRDDG